MLVIFCKPKFFVAIYHISSKWFLLNPFFIQYMKNKEELFFKLIKITINDTWFSWVCVGVGEGVKKIINEATKEVWFSWFLKIFFGWSLSGNLNIFVKYSQILLIYFSFKQNKIIDTNLTNDPTNISENECTLWKNCKPNQKLHL